MNTKVRIIDLVIALKHSCLVKEDSIREEFSLSPAEYRGILSINQGEAVKGIELSEKMGLSVSRGSRVIEKLTKKGYLKEMVLLSGGSLLMKESKRESLIRLRKSFITKRK